MGDRSPDLARSTRSGGPVDLAGFADPVVRWLVEREAERDRAEEMRLGVTHDLRTPLTALRLLATALHDDEPDAETRARYTGQMLRQVAVLGGLLDEMFELSRLEAGDVHWRMEPLEVGPLIDEVLESLSPHASAEGIELRRTLPADLPRARGAPEKVQRVLVNVIQNSLHHTPPGGTVEVEARARGSRIEIEVVDDGPGVRPADRTRVFQPFFRGSAGRGSDPPGAGLGLAISRAIVEAHGGEIWLEDAARGARVRFTLERTS